MDRDRLACAVRVIEERAAERDRCGGFPGEEVEALRGAGVLASPLHGIGTEKEGAGAVRDLLRRLGRASLPVARLFEAHVNAIRLVWRYGSEAAREEVAADVGTGHLFGLWVTDPAGAAGLRLAGGVLAGGKGPCSGAGHCTRALVTVGAGQEARMAVVAPGGTERVQAVAGLTGMRAAAQGVVALDGLAPLCWVGAAGDYLREPEFSCGAWRGSAAALGGLDALVAAVGAGLRARGQAEAPLQLARFGALALAQDAAAAWVDRAMHAAEDAGVDEGERVATVGLARIGVERACLDAIRETQQALGLSAFVQPAPAERVMRDLATYLRQPAGDAVLLEAAAWRLHQR